NGGTDTTTQQSGSGTTTETVVVESTTFSSGESTTASGGCCGVWSSWTVTSACDDSCGHYHLTYAIVVYLLPYWRNLVVMAGLHMLRHLWCVWIGDAP
ncbi:hypothetical protein AAVH_36895, partial [Aphelenchoides avenae]